MKKKIALIPIAVIVFGLAYLYIPDAPPTFEDVNFPDTITIAPTSEALTFARYEVDGKIRLLRVTNYEEGKVTGVDLNAALVTPSNDPATVFNNFGYERIENAISAIPEPIVNVEDLLPPIDLPAAHIAAGTNFAAHADESSVEDGPFLFAKMVEPTPHNAPVPAGNGLLDYEAELAFVTLKDTSVHSPPQYMGLILTNDYTDRATLLRHLNPDDVTSGQGFTTGKSAPGFLPIGNLLVIPKHCRDFAEKLDLNLAVNGQLRQHSNMSLAIWDIDEIFNQTALREDMLWDYRGEQVSLPVEDGIIPARTLILTGTPQGTAFQGFSAKVMGRGILRLIFGGWGESVPDNVIEQYISMASKSGIFLQPGDEVHIQVDQMGIIKNHVE